MAADKQAVPPPPSPPPTGQSRTRALYLWQARRANDLHVARKEALGGVVEGSVALALRGRRLALSLLLLVQAALLRTRRGRAALVL